MLCFLLESNANQIASSVDKGLYRHLDELLLDFGGMFKAHIIYCNIIFEIL